MIHGLKLEALWWTLPWTILLVNAIQPNAFFSRTFTGSFDATSITCCPCYRGNHGQERINNCFEGNKFRGAAAVGPKVIFAPCDADAVGVFDTSTNSFDATTSTGALTMDSKFSGAAVVGTKVVFAPYNADVVGIFDTANNTFDASTSTVSLTMHNKFWGAAAVGPKVVFAPCDADVVGVFDTSTNSFDATTIDSTVLTMDSKFSGAATVGTKVVFAPYNADVVGIFDPVANTFDTTTSTGLGKYQHLFSGAAAVDTRVVFAPYQANIVGVFDTATNTFDGTTSTGILTTSGRAKTRQEISSHRHFFRFGAPRSRRQINTCSLLPSRPPLAPPPRQTKRVERLRAPPCSSP